MNLGVDLNGSILIDLLFGPLTLSPDSILHHHFKAKQKNYHHQQRILLWWIEMITFMASQINVQLMGHFILQAASPLLLQGNLCLTRVAPSQRALVKCSCSKLLWQFLHGTRQNKIYLYQNWVKLYIFSGLSLTEEEATLSSIFIYGFLIKSRTMFWI